METEVFTAGAMGFVADGSDGDKPSVLTRRGCDEDIVVCGAQKPFVRGGAEQHQENLVEALEGAGHRVDLVRLPVAWEKGRLFDSPLAWRVVCARADRSD